MQTDSDNLTLARRYLAAIERGTGGEAGDALSFFAPEGVQEEFPNRLLPHGARRDLAAIREAAERGGKVVAAQRYEVLNAVTSGDQVALEVLWTATLAVPFESIPAGGQMRARFAVFLEFRDGKIVRQGNYDCFDPW
ncbi:MAG: nuclear transport factor 2 family protein [Acidobacteriota bacterium]|nr:nuclear transport factor 2 family protein [Acidobacteriota bacterium]